jgi:ABC-type transport system substrate-binding protein
MIELLTPNINRLGWETRRNDTQDDKQNRPLLLSSASYYGDIKTINEAKRRYSLNDIPNGLESLIYDTLIRYDENDNYFNRLMSRYTNSVNGRERTLLLQALSLSSRNVNILKVLDILISDNVRAQDGSSFFNYLISNNLFSIDITWNWFKLNFDKVLKKYGQGFFFFFFIKEILDSRIAQFITQQFETKEMHDDVKEFFKNRSNSPYIPLILSNILKREKYLNTIYNDLVIYLNK